METLIDRPQSSTRKKWIIMSNLFTWFIPDCVLDRFVDKNPDVKQAWREKTTICIFVLISSVLLVFFIAILPKILCSPDDSLYSMKRMSTIDDKELVILSGKIIDVTEYKHVHPGPQHAIDGYLGQDVTWLFSRPDPLTIRPNIHDFFIDAEKVQVFKERMTESIDECITFHSWDCFRHEYLSINDIDKKYIIGDYVHTMETLRTERNVNWVILYDKVYNISDYIQFGQGIYPSKWDHETEFKPEMYYLDSRLNDTLLHRIGEDATELFEDLVHPLDQDALMDYLDYFYYIGKLDTRRDIVACRAMDVSYFILIGLFTSIVCVKFIFSLCQRRTFPKCNPKDVICFVPCYTEDKKSLEKTIRSIYESEYPEDNIIIFPVVDGVLTGKGCDKSTAEILLNIFDRTLEEETEMYTYRSEGVCDKEPNRVKIFSGYTCMNEKRIRYIITVKVGTEDEQGTDRAGNRGKLDSMGLLFWFLNKLRYNREFDSVQTRYSQAFESFQINPFDIQYFHTIDADTKIHEHALTQFVHNFNQDRRIFAACGETTLSNPGESWVTAIQVYEYFINHSLNKAFESFFSNVTCLPGCFSFYRVFSSDEFKEPLVICDEIMDQVFFQDTETLHTKNLLKLGEDRFLTTLILKYLPIFVEKYKIKYIQSAICETTVPNKWSILLSQRRRWINSTLHNLFELLFIPQCGFFCGMRFLTFMDIIITFMLPIGTLYFVYLIYAFASGVEKIQMAIIISISVVVGIQVLVPLILRDVKKILWLFIYLAAVPIWNVILPLYAFWHQDTFSWGFTRKYVRHDPRNVDKESDI